MRTFGRFGHKGWPPETSLLMSASKLFQVLFRTCGRNRKSDVTVLGIQASILSVRQVANRRKTTYNCRDQMGESRITVVWRGMGSWWDDSRPVWAKWRPLLSSTDMIVDCGSTCERMGIGTWNRFLIWKSHSIDSSAFDRWSSLQSVSCICDASSTIARRMSRLSQPVLFRLPSDRIRRLSASLFTYSPLMKLASFHQMLARSAADERPPSPWDPLPASANLFLHHPSHSPTTPSTLPIHSQSRTRILVSQMSW